MPDGVAAVGRERNPACGWPSGATGSSAFGVCSDSSGPSYTRSGFSIATEGLEKWLEDTYSARMQTLEIRRDAKWVRGAAGQAALLGEWRDEPRGDGH